MVRAALEEAPDVTTVVLLHVIVREGGRLDVSDVKETVVGSSSYLPYFVTVLSSTGLGSRAACVPALVPCS